MAVKVPLPSRYFCKPLHVYLFYLLVLFLPSQLGRHFWFDFSLVRGIRIDYLSPTLYLTDVLLLSTLITWGWVVRRRIVYWIKTYRLIFLGIIFFVAINTIVSTTPFLPAYYWLRYLLFIALSAYVFCESKTFFSKKVRGRRGSIIFFLLAITVLYSSCIALVQFFHQGSVGGALWYLGERTFSGSTIGIANAAIAGRLVLRPYATFSHPNALAGYITVVLALLLFFWGKESKHSSMQKGMLLLTFICGVATLIVTLSRSAWIVGASLALLVAIPRLTNIFKNRLRVRTALILGGVFLWIISMASIFFFFPFTGESFEVRNVLNVAALKMIATHPLIGVGLGNFIPRLVDYVDTPLVPSLLQPAHNMYLLMGAQTGLLGLGVLLFLLFLPIKKMKGKKMYAILPLGAIMALGLTDHYFLTLQQTQLLLAIVAGFVYGDSYKST